MKVAALINYFNDIDMLMMQVRHGQFDCYDKVYICDGPYEYTNIVSFMRDSQPKLIDTEFGNALIKDNKYCYTYNIYKDEYEKRISAYSVINEEIIILHDTDEFYSYDYDELYRFISSEYSVASFACQNLFLTGLYIAPPFYAKSKFCDLPHKNFAFKKSLISPKEHLNYLWLVGVHQEKPDLSKQYTKTVANGHHFTGMRSKDGRIQKFIFYASMYSNINGQNNTGTILKQLVEDNKLNKQEALDIYLKSIVGYAGSPDPERDMVVLDHVNGGEQLEVIYREVLMQLIKESESRATEFTLIPGIPRYEFILPEYLPCKLNIDVNREYNIYINQIIVGQHISSAATCHSGSGGYIIEKSDISNLRGVLVRIIINGTVLSDGLCKAELLYVPDS